VELGLNLGYWGAGNDADNLALAKEADDLGFAVAWVAEAYGSDAPTVLAFVAAQTSRIDLGSAIFQIPGRTPANCAMTARRWTRCPAAASGSGLGVSGPQVSEGWHGVRFDKPLARTREYSDIVKLALSRQKVRYDGPALRLPLPDGPGKALQLTVGPVREHIPMYLAAVGPKNLELAGELFDGWLAIFYSPDFAPEQLGHIPPGGRRSARGWRASTSCRPCRSSSVTTCRPAPSRSAATRPSTSAAWAAGTRTSTTSSPPGWATTRQRRRSRTSTWTGSTRRPAPRAVRVPGRHVAARPQGADRGEDAGLAASGVTTLTLSPFAGSLDERKATLRTASRRSSCPAPAADPGAGRASSGRCRAWPRSCPVSSSAQLVLLPWLPAGSRRRTARPSAAALHAGSCLGICWALRRELRALTVRELAVLAAVVRPGGGRRALAADAVEERLGRPPQLAALLAGAGALMWWVDARAGPAGAAPRRSPRPARVTHSVSRATPACRSAPVDRSARAGRPHTDSASAPQAPLAGLAQVAASRPGVSAPAPPARARAAGRGPERGGSASACSCRCHHRRRGRLTLARPRCGGPPASAAAAAAASRRRSRPPPAPRTVPRRPALYRLGLAAVVARRLHREGAGA
jgi:alkanesulfonate monooxygenase SsuD/methylene tetrahydromethanopterin reductase-like flavin-dependent oxidoreductase (luciferase family)